MKFFQQHNFQELKVLKSTILAISEALNFELGNFLQFFKPEILYFSNYQVHIVEILQCFKTSRANSVKVSEQAGFG